MSKKPAKKQKGTNLRKVLEADKSLEAIKQALGDHVERMNLSWTPEKYVQKAMVAANRNPQLVNCRPSSVLEALQDAAQCGLDPSGLGDEGYLIPYRESHPRGNKCEFIPGYRGLRKNLIRAGVFDNVTAHTVFKCDREHGTFNYKFGQVPDHEPAIAHRPADPQEAWDDIIAAYAIGWNLREDEWKADSVTLVTRAELQRIRNNAPTGPGRPWTEWPERQSRKTAIRRLAKDHDIDPLSAIGATISAIEKHESGGEVQGPAEERALEIPEEPSGSPFQGESGTIKPEKRKVQESQAESPQPASEPETSQTPGQKEPGEAPQEKPAAPEGQPDQIDWRQLEQEMRDEFGIYHMEKRIRRLWAEGPLAGKPYLEAFKNFVLDENTDLTDWPGWGEKGAAKWRNRFTSSDEEESESRQEPEPETEESPEAREEQEPSASENWSEVTIEESGETIIHIPAAEREECEGATPIAKVMRNDTVVYRVYWNAHKQQMECGCVEGFGKEPCRHRSAINAATSG